jgi:hypothetical protein
VGIYVRDATTWQDAAVTGSATLRPHVHNGTAFQPCREVWVRDANDWRVAYQYDTTAPTAATPTVTKLANGATMSVTYGTVTDTESGITSVTLERYHTVGATASSTTTQTTIYSGAATATVAGATFTDSIATSIRKNPTDRSDYFVYYRLRVLDAAGNLAYTAWSTGTATKPLGDFSIGAIDSATWKTSGTPGWRSDTDDVVSGYFDTSYSLQTGYWFYGSQVSSICAGYAPNSGTILMIRQNSPNSGAGSTPNRIAPHGYGTRPTTPTYDTGNVDLTGPTLASGGSLVTYSMPAAWMALMQSGAMDGVAAVNSGATGTDTNGYRRLMGRSSNVYTGLLTLTFT